MLLEFHIVPLFAVIGNQPFRILNINEIVYAVIFIKY